jgi:hypothetical protein
VSDFARARGIDNDPTFVWWVPYTLWKRDIIILAIKTCIRKSTHKYSIEIPTSIKHAYQIDEKNKNRIWRDGVEMELHNVGISFEVLENDTSTPVGWHKATGHLIFDEKMDFMWKA